MLVAVMAIAVRRWVGRAATRLGAAHVPAARACVCKHGRHTSQHRTQEYTCAASPRLPSFPTLPSWLPSPTLPSPTLPSPTLPSVPPPPPLPSLALQVLKFSSNGTLLLSVGQKLQPGREKTQMCQPTQV